jgi:hypothetical protein
VACVTSLSEPNYSATAFVYALENPRSELGCGRSAGVQPMRANAGLATAVVECEAMHGLEVKNTQSSRTSASFCVFSKFQCISSNSNQILLLRYPALNRSKRMYVWAGQLSRYSDWLRSGRSWDRIPVGARFSAPVQTGPGAHPASCTMRTGSFPGVESGQGVTLTPQPLPVPSSKNRIELYLYSP